MWSKRCGNLIAGGGIFQGANKITRQAGSTFIDPKSIKLKHVSNSYFGSDFTDMKLYFYLELEFISYKQMIIKKKVQKFENIFSKVMSTKDTVFVR